MSNFDLYSLHHDRPMDIRKDKHVQIEGLDMPGSPTAHLRRVDKKYEEEFIKFLAAESDHLKTYLAWAANSTIQAAVERLREYTEGIRQGKRLAFFVFGNEFQTPGDMLGFVGLADPLECYDQRFAKLGSYVARHAQGNGYSYRAKTALLHFAREHWRLNRIDLDVANTNKRAQRFARLAATAVRLSAYRMKASPSFSSDTSTHIMDQWSIDLPMFDEATQEQMKDCQRYYNTNEGLVVVCDYSLAPGCFNETIAHQTLIRDIGNCQNNIQLAGPFTISHDCLQLIPSLSWALRRGLEVQATIPELPFYDQEKYQEASGVITELKAANIATEGQGFWRFATILDRKIMWIKKSAGDYHHYGELRYDRWRRVEAERPLSRSTIENLAHEL